MAQTSTINWSKLFPNHRFMEVDKEFDNLYRIVGYLRLAGKVQLFATDDGLFIRKKEEGDGSWTTLAQLDMDGNLYIRGALTHSFVTFSEPGRY